MTMTETNIAASHLLLAALLAALPLSAQTRSLRSSQPTLLEGMAPDRADLDLRRTPVVRAVEQAADSVVSIYVQATGPLARERSIEGQGSGVIIDASGLVITNWHVIATVDLNPNAHSLIVKLRDKRNFDARLLSSSREHDLALLQLELSPGDVVKPIFSSDSETLMVGETVIAIGNPQGHANTVTVGVLSAIDRSISVRTPDRQTRRYRGLLQTDAAINQGNSGGALLDITGRLIGINNAMAVGAENIGFAIPVNRVRQVFQDVLLSVDNLSRVWLGMQVKDQGDYALVTELTAQGPAQRVGLRPGDRLLRAGGEEVRTTLDYARMLDMAKAGQPFPLEVQRSGRRLRLAPKPLTRTSRILVQKLGLDLEQVTRAQDQDLLMQASQNYYAEIGRRPRWLPVALRVTEIYTDGPAEDLDLRVGDVILAVEGGSFMRRWNVLYSGEELAQTANFAAGGELEILLMRGGELYTGDLSVR